MNAAITYHSVGISDNKYLSKLPTVKVDTFRDQLKILSNKLAWIKDQKILIKEFKNQKTPEFLQQINPDGHSVDKEKWDIDENSIIKQADEALEFLQKMEDSLK